MIYALLRNRMELSKKNGWINKNGEVYIIFSREELAQELDCCVKTIIKNVKQLIAAGLLVEKRQGLGKPNLLYICKPRAATSQDLEKIQIRLGKNTSQDLENLQRNYTYNSDTYNSDTYNNKGSVVVDLEKFGVTREGVAAITSVLDKITIRRLLAYARVNNLGAGWLVAAAKDPRKRPAPGVLDAIAAAEAQHQQLAAAIEAAETEAAATAPSGPPLPPEEVAARAKEVIARLAAAKSVN